MDKKKMFADMIALARSAPLQNMAHAEAVAARLKEFAEYAQGELNKDDVKAKIAEQLHHEAGQKLSPE